MALLSPTQRAIRRAEDRAVAVANGASGLMLGLDKANLDDLNLRGTPTADGFWSEDYTGYEPGVNNSYHFPVTTGLGGTVAKFNDPGGFPGIVQLFHGTNAGTGWAGSAQPPSIRPAHGQISWRSVCGFVNLPVAVTTDYIGIMGLIDNVVVEPQYGCYFKFDLASGLQAATANAGVRTYVSITDYTVRAGIIFKPIVILNPFNTSVSYYIDGQIMATITTNMPGGSGGVGGGVAIQKAAGGANVLNASMLVDLQQTRFTLTAPR